MAPGLAVLIHAVVTAEVFKQPGICWVLAGPNDVSELCCLSAFCCFSCFDCKANVLVMQRMRSTAAYGALAVS
jgi:hypothetical protein